MTLFNFVPTGTVLPFAGANAPAGWLICDGSAISRTTYKALFDTIGSAHGSGDGSLTFNIPDLRGRFMRGVDGTAGRDPDKAGRNAAASGGNTGNAVGSVQGNATAKNGLTATSGTSSLSALTMNSSSISSLTLNANSTTVSGAKNQMNGSTGSDSPDHSHGGSTGGNQGNRVWHSQGIAIEAYGSGNTSLANMYQDDETHYHNFTSGGRSVTHSHSWDFGIATFSASGTTPAQTLSSGTAAAQTLSSSTVAAPSITVNAGDNETRPLNANMNFIIKI